jgi:hypothetical protein
MERINNEDTLRTGRKNKQRTYLRGENKGHVED